MSVIKKKPEIEVILSRLNATQLSAVLTAVNSTTPETLKSFVQPSLALATLTNDSPTDIGAYRLELDHQKVRNGICVRILLLGTLYEHFLVYGESQKITIYEIDSVNKTYRLIEEYCDINELRRVINDVGGEESHPGVFTNLHVEGNLKVDGTSELIGEVGIGDSSTVTHSVLLNVHGDAQVHGELMLDSLAHLQNTDGKELIKIVSKVEFEGEYVYETGIVYVVVDDADSTSQTYGNCYVRYYKPVTNE